nr:ATP-binding protein [Collibacillus ludicampi]
MPNISYSDVTSVQAGETSSSIRKRVEQARQRQMVRFPHKTIPVNAWMTTREIRTHCKLSPEGQMLLKQAFENLGLSVRAHHRILKVARTIADLEGVEEILADHVAEAITYRTMDRQFSK